MYGGPTDVRRCVPQYHQASRIDDTAVMLTHAHQCHLCTKLFISRSALEMHMNVHTGARPYVCQVENCTSSFNHKSNLQRHIKDVHGNRQKYLIYKTD